MTKVCTKCGVEKELTGFPKHKTCKFGVGTQCKSCRKAYYVENRERILLQKKEYYAEHTDEILLYKKEYHRKHRAEKNAKSREYDLNHKPERNERAKKYIKNKRRNDPEFSLTCRLRARMYAALKSDQKTGSAVADLGCSIPEFKLYLENQFYNRADGTEMTWENQGDWHLDHVVPLSSFDLNDRTEFLEACNYLNIQPLWAEDNLSKGAR